MTSPLIISIKSTKLTASEKNNLNIFKPYGVILFSRNILNFKQVRNLVKSIKSQTRKTYILIDQEGGMVDRFQKFPEFKFLDNYDYYRVYLRYPSLAKQLVYLKSFITSYYLKEIGITYPQYLVLITLWESDCKKATDIATLLKLDLPTVTPILKKIEKLGLISRERSSDDERIVNIELTKKGIELQESLALIQEKVACKTKLPKKDFNCSISTNEIILSKHKK